MSDKNGKVRALKWRTGMRAYFVTTVFSDRKKHEHDTRPFKFLTVVAGVIDRITLEREGKISVPVAHLVVRNVADGLHPLPDEAKKDGVPFPVPCSELFGSLDTAKAKAQERYAKYRNRFIENMETDRAYIMERLDANAEHLTVMNEAQVWGIERE